MSNNLTGITNKVNENDTGNNIREIPTAVNEYIEMIHNEWQEYSINNPEHKGLTDYFNYKIHNNEINISNILEILNTCDCCDRHQINKPNKLEKWTNTSFQNGGNINYSCKCRCRQISRFICRTCE